MIISNFDTYIKENTKDSLLIKTFAYFLFDDIVELMPEDIDLIKKNKVDYKSAAALGYVIAKSEAEPVEHFLTSIRRQEGRVLTKDSSIIFDNVALLGMIIGLQHCKRFVDFRSWIEKIIHLKSEYPNQKKYTLFFKQLIGESQYKLDDIGLIIFTEIAKSRQDSIPKQKIVDYLQKYGKKSFPYFDNDMLKNLITVYNLDWIIGYHILNQEDFSKQIAQEVEEQIKIIEVKHYQKMTGIKDRIDRTAFGRAIRMYTAILLVLSFLTVLGAIWIWNGDWDWFEPKTYILGIVVAFVYYLITAVVFMIKGKKISLNPSFILASLASWNKRRLYQKYAFDFDSWEELQEKYPQTQMLIPE